MRVLIVEPNKEPYEKDIGNGLKSMQETVGGLIEVMELDRNAVIVNNEEGKILGLEGNRRIGNEIIAGTFFICGTDEYEDFITLTDKQIEKYHERFKSPEHFTSEEVEDSIYMGFYTFEPQDYDDDLER